MQLNRTWAGTRACAIALMAMIALATPLMSAADAAPASARQSPEWLRDAVIYEVFPRAFSPTGDFKGVTAQLDRLKALGVTVLWLMPIHPMGKLKAKGTLGSPYAVRDYDAINPDYGTPDDLKQLVDAAHRRGMKVFIDIVINHTSWDSVLLEKHPDWYTHDSSGKIVPPNPDWVDVADLDWSRPALRQYMTGMLVRWLRDYGLDGFRCDYASGVPTDFWESVRPELDRVRPGLAFLAEADDPALLNKAFDIDYAWDFHHAMSEALVGTRARFECSRSVAARRGTLSARCAAPAFLGQPRPAANDGAGGSAGRARRICSDVHAGRRAAALQRHGGGRHHRVRRTSAVRTHADQLGNGGTSSAGEFLLPRTRGAAARTSGVDAWFGALAAQQRRSSRAVVRARGQAVSRWWLR